MRQRKGGWHVGDAEVHRGIVLGLVEGEMHKVQEHKAARDVRGAVVHNEVVEKSLAWGSAGMNIEVA